MYNIRDLKHPTIIYFGNIVEAAYSLCISETCLSYENNNS